MAQEVAVREGLFVLGEHPCLLGGRCHTCHAVCFPVQEICPYCSGGTVEQIELSREGSLWAWTAVTAPPPGYLGPIPYGFGVVELPEGVRIVTRLTEPDPQKLELGQPMKFVLIPMTPNGEAGGGGDTVLTYAFAPASP